MPICFPFSSIYFRRNNTSVSWTARKSCSIIYYSSSSTYRTSVLRSDLLKTKSLSVASSVIPWAIIWCVEERSNINLVVLRGHSLVKDPLQTSLLLPIFRLCKNRLTFLPTLASQDSSTFYLIIALVYFCVSIKVTVTAVQFAGLLLFLCVYV